VLSSITSQLTLLRRTAPHLPSIALAQVGLGSTTGDLVASACERHGDRVMVRFEGRRLTYADMGRAMSRVARWAQEEGLGRGDVVALMMENRPEFLQVWMGLCQAGITTALINTKLTGAGLEHALTEANSACVIVGGELTGVLEQVVEQGCESGPVWVLADGPSLRHEVPDAFRSLDGALADQSGLPVPAKARKGVSPRDPLFYIYTSGTTGLPKAAKFSHARFLGAGLLALAGGFGRDDTMYCALPLYHTAGGVIGVSAVMQTGATIALARRFRASRFFFEATALGATAIQYIGEIGRYLVAQPERPSDRAHRIRLAVGNGLSADVWQSFLDRFGISQVVEFYAATESNVAMVNTDGPTGSIGKPNALTRVELVRFDHEAGVPLRDEDGCCIKCDVDEPGEALGKIMGGPVAMSGFEGYTSSEATEAKLLRGVFSEGDCWFRTGDLLRRDADGWYWFVDRVGDTFRWKGENVSTQEVANVVVGAPGVLSCVVYGVEVPGADGRAGMATIAGAASAAGSRSNTVDREGAGLADRLDLEALYSHLAANLPSFARPVFLRVTAEIEATGTFKLRKVDLVAQGLDQGADEDVLLVRDDELATFVEFDAAARSAFEGGQLRV